MNGSQNMIFIIGLLVTLFIVVQKPIRHQNPFYAPIIESMSDYTSGTHRQTNPVDESKNYFAAGFVLVAMGTGIYFAREKRPVQPA